MKRKSSNSLDRRVKLKVEESSGVNEPALVFFSWEPRTEKDSITDSITSRQQEIALIQRLNQKDRPQVIPFVITCARPDWKRPSTDSTYGTAYSLEDLKFKLTVHFYNELLNYDFKGEFDDELEFEKAYGNRVFGDYYMDNSEWEFNFFWRGCWAMQGHEFLLHVDEVTSQYLEQLKWKTYNLFSKKKLEGFFRQEFGRYAWCSSWEFGDFFIENTFYRPDYEV